MSSPQTNPGLQILFWFLKMGACTIAYMSFLLLAAFSLDSSNPVQGQDKTILMVAGLPALTWIATLLADFIRIWVRRLSVWIVVAGYVLGVGAMFFYFVFVIFLLK